MDFMLAPHVVTVLILILAANRFWEITYGPYGQGVVLTCIGQLASSLDSIEGST